MQAALCTRTLAVHEQAMETTKQRLDTAAYQETIACLLARKAGEVGGRLLHMTQSIVEVVTEVDCTALPVTFLPCRT